MLETRYPSRVFRDVNFVLFGFDSVTESKIRFKLVNGGGVDVGQYSGSCTHVIVDKIEYDDPVCVAARDDRKTLVTALWVEHSADIGMPVDAASVMYRPLKNLNGIPGAKTLILCLTGYLRQDRDDIMTMVGLMGAQFSKPLVANKVTHLVCYKFEGEKYELAKRLGTIKLVNHRWLEDCLKNWLLLPEDKYNKSGFELETMEEEAKDSEEEAEDSKLGQSGGRNRNKSPRSSKSGTAMSHGLSKSAREASNAFPDSTGPQVLPKVDKGKDPLIISGNQNRFDQDLNFHCVDDQKISNPAPVVSWHSTSCQLPDTFVKASESNNADFPKALGCQDFGITGNTISSDQQPDLHDDAFGSKKLVSDLRSTSASTEGFEHLDVKLSAMSYARKNQRGFTLPRILDEFSGREGNKLETSSSKVEKASEGIQSTCLEGSGKRSDFVEGNEPISLLPQKRTNEAAPASTKLKSRKMTADAKVSIERMPLANGKSQGLKVKSLVDEAPVADGYFSVSKDGINNSSICLNSKSAACNSHSMAFDEPSSRNVSSESAQCDNTYQNSAQMAVQRLSECKSTGKPDITGFGMGQVDDNKAEQHNVTKHVECSPTGNEKSRNEESTGLTSFDLSNEENNKLIKKPPRKKSVAKRSLGSRPKFGGTAKQKSSVSLNKTNPQGKGVCLPIESKEIATCDANKLQVSPQSLDVNKSMEQETIIKYAEDAGRRTEFLDDETEAPDDTSEYGLGMALDEELFHLSKKADTATEEKSGANHHTTKSEEGMLPNKGTNETEKQKPPSLVDSPSKLKEMHQARKCPAGRTKKTTVANELLKSEKAVTATEEKSGANHHKRKCEEAMLPKKGTNETEKQKPPSLVDSTSKLKVKHQARKRPAGRTKKTTVANELSKSEEALSEEKVHDETRHLAEKETLEEMSLPADISDSSTVPRNKSGNFVEEEKENRPIDGEQDVVEGRSVGNPTIKSSVKPAKINSKRKGLNPSISESNARVKTETACFILKGHYLQRKEFQQVIKRLKGRVCRDSHQWSYQATHFIAPDPIRRTEKFFAAAASGRWILKTDFLTASSQAGKFLLEEPYEWHQNGLSEDGTINMEAPRKWRLLKERTGHGAFYGMRIVVYGDCITPSLDTLKRVVKAGDGTILATSPPYSRFLGTGIDYAIVSPGMPRVDMWVQEFLKHEIPCVVADYMVEYVCKPGFSLEKHVLYGTHAWAEKSYAKLQSRAEEIIEELIPPEDCSDDDIICQVCGSRDRGDVMLICGDESGSLGCGIGTHIDCCDPPLTDVPEEDWFCPKCSTTRKCSNNPMKKRKKCPLSLSKIK